MVAALTIEQFKEALPDGMQKNVNHLVMMQINNTLENPEEWDAYKENLLSYTSVLRMGKFKMEQYVNAVRYVGFKVMEYTNKDAYRKTFPEKYANFKATGVSDKDISSYTAAYNKSKLVCLIFGQTLIPTHILNAPMFQKAINVQAGIMMDETVSPKVRSDAANSLMTHLKAPEVRKVELDIGPVAGNIIDDYEVAMNRMVKTQLELMQGGGDVKAITNAPITVEDKEGAVDI